MSKHCIAFKLNYCNGGANSDCIGFRGICNDALIDYNVNIAGRGWCSHRDNFCRKYLEGKISREELERKWLDEDSGFCNESVTLSEKYYSWFAEAGWGGNPQHPFRIINKDLAGHLCVLTTVYPNMSDLGRFVFAMFVIKGVCDGGDDRPDYVEADDYWRLEFRPNEATQIKFWDTFSGKPPWRQGLFRYFDDATAVKFLERAIEGKRGTPEEDFAKEFLKQYPYK